MTEVNVQKNINDIHRAFAERKGQTLLHHLGIELTELSQTKVTGTMPVDGRTHQLYGMLHGGASVAFAESLCSIGAYLFIDGAKFRCVGLEINANHIKGMQTGIVYGEAKPMHIGRRTQIWSIEIRNEKKDLVCLSRCTIAVVENS